MQIIVRDNNVEQALRALKKKLQREGIYREMKLRRHYEKPSEKRARERAAAIGLAWAGAGKLRPEVSETGLEFRTMKAGTGEPIGPNDAAVIDYILTADDGTVFDTSQSFNGSTPCQAPT